MSRKSRLTIDQIQAICELVERGTKPRYTRGMLEDRFGLTTARDASHLAVGDPRLKTIITETIIKGVVKQWQEKDASVREKDAPVVWHDFITLERMGIRLDMLPRLKAFPTELQRKYPRMYRREPSYRGLMWLQYVLVYNRDISIGAVYYLAKRYQQESFRSDYYHKNPDFSLLETCLNLGVEMEGLYQMFEEGKKKELSVKEEKGVSFVN